MTLTNCDYSARDAEILLRDWPSTLGNGNSRIGASPRSSPTVLVSPLSSPKTERWPSTINQLKQHTAHAISVENLCAGTLGPGRHLTTGEEDMVPIRGAPIPSPLVLNRVRSLLVGVLTTYSTFETGSPRYRLDKILEAHGLTLISVS